MAGQRPALSGPLVCSDIANDGQVDSREDIILALSNEAQKVAEEFPGVRKDCFDKGHDLCDPFICLGLKTPANFGRWTQVVSYQPDEAHSKTDNDSDNSAGLVLVARKKPVFSPIDYRPTYTSVIRYKHFGTVLKSSSPSVANLLQSILQMLDPAVPLLHSRLSTYHLPPLLRLCCHLRLCQLLLQLLRLCHHFSHLLRLCHRCLPIWRQCSRLCPCRPFRRLRHLPLRLIPLYLLL